MTGKMNWARVQKENQLRRRGSENMMVDAGLDGPTPVGRKKKLTKKKRRSDLKINAKTRIAQEIAAYKANPPPAKLIRGDYRAKRRREYWDAIGRSKRPRKPAPRPAFRNPANAIAIAPSGSFTRPVRSGGGNRGRP